MADKKKKHKKKHYSDMKETPETILRLVSEDKIKDDSDDDLDDVMWQRTRLGCRIQYEQGGSPLRDNDCKQFPPPSAFDPLPDSPPPYKPAAGSDGNSEKQQYKSNPPTTEVVPLTPVSTDSDAPLAAETRPPRTGKQKCMSCCKSCLTFVFSTIGLTCIMVGYVILGGFIFKELEAPNESKVKNDVVQKRIECVEKLWNMTMRLNILYRDNWTQLATKELEKYTTEVYIATKKDGWDGPDKDGDSELQWTFAGAMLYSITIITTIGYGHIAPKTDWGMAVTIIYAIFGIPITLCTIANLGGFMATMFRFLYNKICCGVCCICCKKEVIESSLAAEKGETAEIIPSNAKRKQRWSLRVYWRHGIRNVVKTQNGERLSVPIYVSLILITSYVMIGAALFSIWEDWDYLEGSYFCVITLTTIGFGDYVPGTGYKSWHQQQKLVICCFYLIFGLSLIAMCFDLMQEEARNHFRTLGRKLGIIEDDKGAKNKAKSRNKSVTSSPPGMLQQESNT